MLIARGQTIDGVEAREVRDVLRRLVGSVFTADGFALIVKVPTREAAAMFGLLERHGLITSGADMHAGPVVCGETEDVRSALLWQTTVAGNALAKARVGTPMPRARAEALLEEVIGRAQAVNADPDRLFWIDRVELFGSLARPDAGTVGDIDLRVLFTHRYVDDDLVAQLEQRWPKRAPSTRR